MRAALSQASSVSRMIKRRCAAVGLDPALFASHSLRSGFITSAATEGAPIAAIALHAGHKKFDTTMGYDPDDQRLQGSCRQENPVANPPKPPKGRLRTTWTVWTQIYPPNLRLKPPP
jgi:hypothetical protein